MYNKNLYNESTFNDPGASTRVMQARTSFVVDVEGRAETASTKVSAGLKNSLVMPLTTNAGISRTEKADVELVANVTDKVHFSTMEYYAGTILDEYTTLNIEGGIARKRNTIGAYVTNVLDRSIKTTPVVEVGVSWTKERSAHLNVGTKRVGEGFTEITADVLEKAIQAQIAGEAGLSTSKDCSILCETGTSHALGTKIDLIVDVAGKIGYGFTELNAGSITKRLTAGEYHAGYGLAQSASTSYEITATEKTLLAEARTEIGLIKLHLTQTHGDVGITETYSAPTYFRWGIVVGAYFGGIKRTANAPTEYWADLVDMTQYLTGMFNVGAFNTALYNDAGKPRRVMRAGCSYSIGCEIAKTAQIVVGIGTPTNDKAGFNAVVGLSWKKTALLTLIADSLERKQKHAARFEIGFEVTDETETFYHTGLNHIVNAEIGYLLDVLNKTVDVPLEANAGFMEDSNAFSVYKTGIECAQNAVLDSTLDVIDKTVRVYLVADAGAQEENQTFTLSEAGLQKTGQAEISGCLDVIGRIERNLLAAYAGIKDGDQTHSSADIGVIRLGHGVAAYFVDLEIMTRILHAPAGGYAGIADIAHTTETFYENGLRYVEGVNVVYTSDVTERKVQSLYKVEVGIECDGQTATGYEAGIESVVAGVVDYTLDALDKTVQEVVRADVGIVADRAATSLHEAGLAHIAITAGTYVVDATGKTRHGVLKVLMGLSLDAEATSGYEAGVTRFDFAIADYRLNVLEKTFGALYAGEVGLTHESEITTAYNAGLTRTVDSPSDYKLDVPDKTRLRAFVADIGTAHDGETEGSYEIGLSWVRTAPTVYIYDTRIVLYSPLVADVGLADKQAHADAKHEVGIEQTKSTTSHFVIDALGITGKSYIMADAGIIGQDDISSFYEVGREYAESIAGCFVINALEVTRQGHNRMDVGIADQDEVGAVYEIGLAYVEQGYTSYTLGVLEKVVYTLMRADVGLADLFGDVETFYEAGLAYTETAHTDLWIGVTDKKARQPLLAEAGLIKTKHGVITYFVGCTRENTGLASLCVNVLDKTRQNVLVAEVGLKKKEYGVITYFVGYTRENTGLTSLYVNVLDKTRQNFLVAEAGLIKTKYGVITYFVGCTRENTGLASLYANVLDKTRQNLLVAEVGVAGQGRFATSVDIGVTRQKMFAISIAINVPGKKCTAPCIVEFWFSASSRQVHTRLQICRTDGTTWEDVTSYLETAEVELGSIENIGTGTGADIGVQSLTFTLRNADGNSFAPRDKTSVWNKFRGKWNPLLWPYREVALQVAVTMPGCEPAQWLTLFEGYLGDKITTNHHSVTVQCRDKSKRLQDAYIDVPKTYEGPISAEDLIQSIINDYVDAPPVLYCPVPSGITFDEMKVEYIDVWGAIQNVANQMGWFLGYRWNGEQFVLTLLEPPRDKTTADYNFDWKDDIYQEVLEIGDSEIRNALTLIYRDKDTGQRVTLRHTDYPQLRNDGSIAEYTRRIMQIEEADTSLIDTQEKALAFGEKCIWDLSELSATDRLDLPLFPELDLFSTFTVTNPLISSTKDFYSVQSIRHTLRFGERAKFRTEVIATGRVVGARTKWLDMETRPGRPGKPIDPERMPPDSLPADRLPDYSLGADKFVESVKPVLLVNQLPELPDPRYPVGTIVFVFTEEKLYRNDGEIWVPLVKLDAAELEGKLQSNQIALEAITEDLIAADAIANRHLQIDAVEAPNISAKAITGPKIATGAITETKISDNAISTPKLQAGAVEAEKIAAGAVEAEKIAANAVTAGKIAAGAIETNHISAGAVKADQIDANAVTASKILAGSVTTSHIAARAITAQKIATGAITANEIAARAITAAEIAAGAITGDKIAANAVTAGKIQAGAISANHISSNGLHIRDGKLTLTNPQGTVIIDGTSNMFKIAKTGFVWAKPNRVTSINLSIPGSGEPAFMMFIEDLGIQIRTIAGTVYLDGCTPLWFFNDGARLISHYLGILASCERTSPSNVRLNVYGGVENTGSWFCRYYIFKEAAF